MSLSTFVSPNLFFMVIAGLIIVFIGLWVIFNDY